MAFPTTPIIDNFNRANASTLGTGWSFPFYTDGLQESLQVISNQAGHPGPDGGNNQHIYSYRTIALSGNQEAYVTISALPDDLVNVNSPICLWCRLTGLGGLRTNLSGYELRYFKDISTAEGTFFITRHPPEFATLLSLTTTTPALIAGDSFGMAVYGTNPVIIESWYRRGAGAWTMSGSASDNTASRLNPAASYVLLENTQSAVRFNDFGGSNIVAPESFTKGVTGSIYFSGVTKKRTSRKRVGTLIFAGTIGRRKVVKKALAAAITFTKVVKRRTGKKLLASVVPTGIVKRLNRKKLLAVLSLIGNLNFPAIGFPQRGIFDNFNRTDANDLGPTWGGPLYVGQEEFKVINNAATHDNVTWVGPDTMVGPDTLADPDGLVGSGSTGYSANAAVSLGSNQEFYIKVVQKSGIVGGVVRLYNRFKAS